MRFRFGFTLCVRRLKTPQGREGLGTTRVLQPKAKTGLLLARLDT